MSPGLRFLLQNSNYCTAVYRSLNLSTPEKQHRYNTYNGDSELVSPCLQMQSMRPSNAALSSAVDALPSTGIIQYIHT